MLGGSPWPPRRMFLWLASVVMFSFIGVECQLCDTSGMNEFGGSLYVFLHDGVRTYTDARSYCQGLGGDLPVITSAEQNAHIAGLLQKASPDRARYWIGLEDMDRDGAFQWIDGTQKVYTNWESNLRQVYCAYIIGISNNYAHGKWSRIECATPRRHICQIPVDTYCTWHELGDSQYLIKGDYKSPADARKACQSYEGDLALIKTKDVNDFLKDLVPRYENRGSCSLFGLSRLGEGAFTWIDGTQLEFDAWSSTEPNDPNSWGCFSTYVNAVGEWYDSISPRQYICERTRVHQGTNEVRLDTSYYYISAAWMNKDFSRARMYCQTHGGDLALIQSQEVNDFLERATPTGRSPPCFNFGLIETSTNREYMWIDGSPLQYVKVS